MDFYLYLIFSVAIYSMVRIRCMINLQTQPDQLEIKLIRLRKCWCIFFAFELTSMLVAQSIL